MEGYVCLGQAVRMDDDVKEEVSRRQRAAWGRFKEISDILKSKLKRETKAKLFSSRVLKAIRYSRETWLLTTAEESCTEEKQLQVMQWAMERSMIGISLRNKVKNDYIRGADHC